MEMSGIVPSEDPRYWRKHIIETANMQYKLEMSNFSFKHWGFSCYKKGAMAPKGSRIPGGWGGPASSQRKEVEEVCFPLKPGPPSTHSSTTEEYVVK